MTDRDLIVLCAEKVLGWEPKTALSGMAYCSHDGWKFTIWPNGATEGWNPLNQEYAAWMLVDALTEKGWLVSVRQMPRGVPFLLGGDSGSEYAGEDRPTRVPRRAACVLEWHGDGFKHSEFAFHDDRRRAIVLACLAAVGVSDAA